MAAAPATPRPCVHCSVGSWSSPSVLEAPGWYQCHREAGREPAQRCAVTWPHSVWRGLKESEEEEARGGHPGPARPLTRPPSLSLPFQAPERTTGADPHLQLPEETGAPCAATRPACIPARRAPSPALTTLNPRSVLPPPARHRGMEPPMGPSGSARRRLQVDPREHVAAKRFKR